MSADPELDRLLVPLVATEEDIAAALIASLERQNLFYRTNDRTIEADDDDYREEAP